MKKIALSLAAFAVSAGAALAADLPSRKGPPILPPPPPPPPLWTGFYVGLNAGGTWANSNTINVLGGNAFTIAGLNGDIPGAMAFHSTASLNSGTSGGFIGGGQIGYNYQFYNNFVVGIEADIQGLATSNSFNSRAIALTPGFFVPVGSASVVGATSSLDYIGTVRGRLGWLATPTLLLYGTGGLAYGGVNLNTATTVSLGFVDTPFPFVTGGSFSDTRVGWTAGGGVEWMFWPNWSAKVEYLYYDLGSLTFNSAPLVQTGLNGALLETVTAQQVSHRFNGNIVRAGLNYHFNWGAPAPVVAKY
ncbi:outer membrane protein [Methylocystis sp. JAN1]|uniref:outer membrane protein n=1 Tax=Methylocystis sp. JAN1 TaxID=3397211 RepID=UPI003FA27134